MHVDDIPRAAIVQLAWHAAGHISVPAMLAVMFVVKNRLGDTKDWMIVIEELSAQLGVVGRHFDTRGDGVRAICDLVDSVYTGDTGEIERRDIFTNGAIYFWDGSVPCWFDVEGKERVGVVGSLQLWK